MVYFNTCANENGRLNDYSYMNRKKRSNLKQDLLEAAEKRIHEGGLEALSLRKLASDVGVTTMATYHHFANKKALLVQDCNQMASTILNNAFRLQWRKQNHRPMLSTGLCRVITHSRGRDLMFTT